MILTKEQQAIVDASVRTSSEGRRLKVVAGAGTGKTATLIAVADRLAKLSRRVLYLAYNRAIVDESRPRFQNRADVTTLHSLAYRHMNVGRIKSSRKMGRIYPSSVVEVLHLPAVQYDRTAMWHAKAILGTLNAFYASSELRISVEHVPAYVSNALPDTAVTWIAERAWELFEHATPDSRSSLPLPHDLYLKAWQVAGTPGLEQYDTVLLDEAQDANPLIVNAIAGAKHAVFVGDEHQAIYAFRGAVNAMSMLDGVELPLTQSFRWGNAVANAANRLLSHKRVAPKWQLRGNPDCDTRLERVFVDSPHARIYRGNKDLIQDALFLSYNSSKEDVAMVGDRRDLASSLRSADALIRGDLRQVRHRLLAEFDSWDEFLDVVNAGGASAQVQELQQLKRLVDDYGPRLPDLVALLDNEQDESKARFTLTTAHRSKGREWNDVVITQDFDSTYDRTADKPDEREHELNLMYVALTRARSTLDIQSLVINEFISPGSRI